MEKLGFLQILSILLELKEEKNLAKGLEIRLRSADLDVLDEFEKVLIITKRCSI